MKTQLHPFHLVEFSPWPLFLSFNIINLLLSAVGYMHNTNFSLLSLTLSFIVLFFCIILWFNDVTIEGTYIGYHTKKVVSGLNIGFNLFVVSEIIFFFSLFWAYLHSSLSPDIILGAIWPPVGINAMDPIQLPLLNTILLLSSGFTITFAHHAIISNDTNSRYYTILGFILTILLGVLFILCQFSEYYIADFSFSDSVLGSAFYIATGFHGLHIIIGALMLAIILYRLLNYHFTQNHHAGLNIAILYWHFVDVVWLFVFGLIYVWASL